MHFQSIVTTVTGSIQTKESAHYASMFDAASESAQTADSSYEGHRTSQTESVELELAQVRARLDKLRQGMRSALDVRTAVGLGLSAAVLIVLAVLALVSLISHDSGLGMLLGGLFVAGVPLTGVAAIRAAGPWWLLSNEAALLRQREAQLHAHWDRTVVASDVPRQTSDTSDDGSERFWGAPEPTTTGSSLPLHGVSSYQTDSGYGLSGQSWSPGSDPLTGYAADEGASDSEALHLAEYNALSPSSHMLARALRQTLGTPPAVTPAPAADSYRNHRLADIASAQRSRKRRGSVSIEPSWWSPTGLNARAMRHAKPAAAAPAAVSGWGLLLLVGAVMTLFALGIIAGVLSST